MRDARGRDARRRGRAAVRRPPPTAQILIRLPQTETAEQGTSLEQGVAAGRSRRCRRPGLPKFEIVSRDLVGPVDRRRPAAHAASTPRWPRCSAITIYIGVPLPVLASRIGAIAATLPRRARDAGVPDVLRLRPVAERRGRHPDDHRLLGERHRSSSSTACARTCARCGASRSNSVVNTSVNQTLRAPSSPPAPRSCRCWRCTSSAARCCAASRSRCSSASSAAPTPRCSSPRPSPSSSSQKPAGRPRPAARRPSGAGRAASTQGRARRSP